MNNYKVTKYLLEGSDLEFELRLMIDEIGRKTQFFNKSDLVWRMSSCMLNKIIKYTLIEIERTLEFGACSSVKLLGIEVETTEDTMIRNRVELIWKGPYSITYSNPTFTFNDLLRMSTREIPNIKKVIFNNPATIVYWGDGSKTVVKCQHGDTFDKEKGLAMAFVKKCWGNKGNFNDKLKKYVSEEK